MPLQEKTTFWGETGDGSANKTPQLYHTCSSLKYLHAQNKLQKKKDAEKQQTRGRIFWAICNTNNQDQILTIANTAW